MTTNRKHETLLRSILWTGVVILIITLFVSSFLRISNLDYSIRTGIMPLENSIDFGLAQKPFLTLLHILPGCLFLLLGVWQFIRPFRNRYISFHRWMGRLYILIGLLVAITALIMGFVVRFGGWTETVAVTIFGIYFLYALLKAYRHIRKKEYKLHREWMIRAFSVGIAVATMRPVIGLFFAFTDIPFHKFFGPTFWIAFLLHLLVAEAWIRYTR